MTVMMRPRTKLKLVVNEDVTDLGQMKWYTQFGFEVTSYETYDIPNIKAYPSWGMVRSAKSKAT